MQNPQAHMNLPLLRGLKFPPAQNCKEFGVTSMPKVLEPLRVSGGYLLQCLEVARFG